MSLSGFDDRPKSPEDWRAYISQLHKARDDVLSTYEDRVSGERLSYEEHRKFWSRVDVLCEFIRRAESELNTDDSLTPDQFNLIAEMTTRAARKMAR